MLIYRKNVSTVLQLLLFQWLCRSPKCFLDWCASCDETQIAIPRAATTPQSLHSNAPSLEAWEGLSWSVRWASEKWLIPPASSLNYTSPGCISNTQIWDLSWSPHQALSKKVNEGISQDVRLSFNLVFQPLFQQSLPPPGCPVSSCMPQLCKFAHLISTLITHSSPPNPPFSCFLHISSFGSSSLIIWDTWCRVWHEPVWKQHGTPRGLSVVRIYQNMNYGSYENE